LGVSRVLMESCDVAFLFGNLLARLLQAFWHNVVVVTEFC
jgi:hypothetical protein